MARVRRNRPKPSLRVTSNEDKFKIGSNALIAEYNVKLRSSLGLWRSRYIRILQHSIIAFESSSSNVMVNSLSFAQCLTVELFEENNELRFYMQGDAYHQGFGRIRTASRKVLYALHESLRIGIEKRIVPKNEPELEPASDQWSWRDEYGIWRIFAATVRNALSEAIMNGKIGVNFSLSTRKFEVDLTSMCMRNVETGKMFAVRKCPDKAIASARGPSSSSEEEKSAEKPTFDQVKKISDFCKSSGESFVDPSFPPGPKSLYIAGSRVQTDWDCGQCTVRNPANSIVCSCCNAQRIVVKNWLRPIQAKKQDWRVFDESPSPKDIQQGALGNCWFLSALSVLTERPSLLRKLVGNREFNPAGVYLINLCKDGIWQSTIIDDFFPCSHSGRLAYSQACRNQLWVPLIEKAMAKMFGSYEAISSGQIYDGMSILTGFPVQKIDLRPDSERTDASLMRVDSTSALGMMGYEDANLDSDILWIKLLSFREAGYLMGASCGIYEEEEAQDIHTIVGLQKFHAYSVLDVRSINELRLVLLRNPWGRNDRCKWNGDWSDSSPLWTSELRNLLQPNREDAGIFWMSFSDLKKYFGRIDVCKLRDHWLQARFRGQFVNTNSSNVEVYTIRSSGTVQLEVSLQQPSERGQTNSMPPVDIALTIMRRLPDGSFELVDDCRRTTSIYVSVEFIVERGYEYVIVPLGFNKILDTTSFGYVLAVHSSDKVQIETLSKEIDLLAQAMALRARKHGECKQVFDRMIVYTQSHDAGTVVVAENRHASEYFQVEMNNEESFNICSSRGSLHTSDSIPPGHFQIIQILAQVADSGYSWSSKLRYNAGSKGEEHVPSIRAPGIHCPQRFLS